MTPGKQSDDTPPTLVTDRVLRLDRRSEEYHEALWRKWPRPDDWPGHLDLYEAAAYKRVDYVTLWRACQRGRDGRARLAHQRFGSTYRLSKAALDRFGLVLSREVAV